MSYRDAILIEPKAPIVEWRLTVRNSATFKLCWIDSMRGEDDDNIRKDLIVKAITALTVWPVGMSFHFAFLRAGGWSGADRQAFDWNGCTFLFERVPVPTEAELEKSHADWFKDD